MYNLLAQQRLNEIEVKLEKTLDIIEKMHMWSIFIDSFSEETQTSFDKHYTEFLKLCEKYVLIPDPVARKDLKEQIKTVALELRHFNSIMTRVTSIQKTLEKALIS